MCPRPAASPALSFGREQILRLPPAPAAGGEEVSSSRGKDNGCQGHASSSLPARSQHGARVLPVKQTGPQRGYLGVCPVLFTLATITVWAHFPPWGISVHERHGKARPPHRHCTGSRACLTAHCLPTAPGQHGALTPVPALNSQSCFAKLLGPVPNAHCCHPPLPITAGPCCPLLLVPTAHCCQSPLPVTAGPRCPSLPVPAGHPCWSPTAHRCRSPMPIAAGPRCPAAPLPGALPGPRRRRKGRPGGTAGPPTARGCRAAGPGAGPGSGAALSFLAAGCHLALEGPGAAGTPARGGTPRPAPASRSPSSGGWSPGLLLDRGGAPPERERHRAV